MHLHPECGRRVPPHRVDKFTATYSGDANFASGTTGSTTAFVNRSTVTTAITVNPQNPVYGQCPVSASPSHRPFRHRPDRHRPDPLVPDRPDPAVHLHRLHRRSLTAASSGCCTSSTQPPGGPEQRHLHRRVLGGHQLRRPAPGPPSPTSRRPTTATTVTPTTANPTYGQPQTFTVTQSPRRSPASSRPGRSPSPRQASSSPCAPSPCTAVPGPAPPAAGTDRFRHRLPGQLLRGHQLPGLDRAELGQHRRRPSAAVTLIATLSSTAFGSRPPGHHAQRWPRPPPARPRAP